MKIKLEIDINNLINTNISTHEQKREIPTVDASYNNEWLNQEKVWYKIYKNGESRWVRIEGRGEDCMTCHDIIFRKSPGNTDTLIDTPTGYHPNFGDVTFDDYPENMYVQSERLRQLEQLNYVEGEDNFIELV